MNIRNNLKKSVKKLKDAWNIRKLWISMSTLSKIMASTITLINYLSTFNKIIFYYECKIRKKKRYFCIYFK